MAAANDDSLFAPIAAAPAYRLVADAIEREIVDGRIQPGEAIGTEAALVRQFGVNRSTVREGLRCMEQSGLLTRGPDRRLVAALPSRDKLASRTSRALVLHQVTFRELCEAVDMLETMAMDVAIDRRSDADLAAVADNIERSRAALDDPAAMADLEAEFHSLIAEATGNRVLQLAREPSGLMIRQTTRMIFETVPEASRRSLEAREHLLEALRRADRGAARMWMRRHVADFAKGFARTGISLDAPVARAQI